MLVTTRDQFERAIDTLWPYRASGFVVDCEGTGLNMFKHTDPARMCSIQLAPIADISKQFFFPFRHGEGQNLPLEWLQPLRELLAGAGWLGHNVGGYDVKLLMQDGFELPAWVRCSMIAMHTRNENEKQSKLGKPYALKKLCGQYFGEQTIQASVDLKAELKTRGLSTADGGMSNLWRLPPEVVYNYGVADLSLSHRLHEFAMEDLRKWRLEEAYLERCELQLELIRMENRGLPLDQQEVKRQMLLIGPRQAELVAEMKELAAQAGISDLNPNSPQQLMQWLGLPKTDKKFLQAVMEKNPHPGIRSLLEYREIKKAASTYFEPWLELVDKDSRLHTNLKVTGTRTGRLSSNNPNMQNCSRDRSNRAYSLKRCFVASPGHFLFEADYSTLEPRVGAWLSKDRDSIEVFQKGLDYYRPIAAKMFRMNEADITDEIRGDAKSTILGVGYSMGGFKLAVTLNLRHNKQADGSYEYHYEPVWRMAKNGELEEVACSEVDASYCTCEGRTYIKMYYDAMPSMQRAIKGVAATGKRNGYIRYPVSGRVRHLERYYDTERKRMDDNSHKLWNAALQGTGADIMNKAIVAIGKAIPESRARSLLTVHDSLLCEIPLGPGAKETCDEILRLMETTTRIDPVPLVAEAKFGPTWSNMAKYVR